MKKRVAVIGGGLTGIGCLVELLQAGHDVRLYERNDDIGGVWHPSNCYSGLSLHGAAASFEYHDFPLPDGIDKSRPMTSAQVYDYLRSYFRHKNLDSHSEFGTAVETISYSRADRQFTLRLRKRGSDEEHTAEFDYVVYTHGFAARTVPEVEGSARFTGEILHSFDLTETKLTELVDANRKIVVVGGSKTATDLILRFDRRQSQVQWLYRKNYWFVRSDPLFDVAKRRVAGGSGGFFHRTALFVGELVGTKMPRLHLALWRACGLAHTFGPKHWDFTRYHRGRIEQAAMAALTEYAGRNGVQGEIAGFSETGLKLKNGRTLACDTVVFCTGSSAHNSLVAINVDGAALDPASVKRVYRARVIPEIPGLVFTAFHLFSFGVVNGLMTGRWIVRFIESRFGEDYLAEHATTFDPPFLASPSYLFDSSSAFNVRASKMLDPFFESGELKKWVYFRWLWEISFARGGVPPLDIAAPRGNELTAAQENPARLPI
jgi:dimethylaniline monooxygenase (N-oxide forming)